MTQRANPYLAHPNLLKPLIDYAHTVQAMGLEKSLVELIKIRASQINGCAVCLHMHAAQARRQGETEDRILMLDAWAECPFYTAREKAALAWTDALTRLAETHASDQAHDEMCAHFSSEEQVILTQLIGVINMFNRIGVGFRVGPVTLQTAA
jgi:AhpD family alkylhydroperoxidase